MSTWLDKDKAATGTAIVALIAFGISVFVLYSKVGVTDPVWSRLTYLLTAIEAVAFGGVGFLWGREVHRGGALMATKALTALRNQIRADAEEAQANLRGVPEETRRWQALERLASDLA